MSRLSSPLAGEHSSVLALPAVDASADGSRRDLRRCDVRPWRSFTLDSRASGAERQADRVRSRSAGGRCCSVDRRSSFSRRAHAVFTAASHARRTCPSRECRECCSTWVCRRRRSTIRRADFRCAPMGHWTCAWTPSRGETAAEWLARASFEELAQVIRDYGEERFAASIAKAIVARRADAKAGDSRGRFQRPQTLRLWSRTPSAGAARMRLSIRRRGLFRLYGFTSIGSLRNWR